MRRTNDQILMDSCQKTVEQVLESLGSSKNGLSDSQVETALAEFGPQGSGDPTIRNRSWRHRRSRRRGNNTCRYTYLRNEGFFFGQSSLTGESIPMEKHTNIRPGQQMKSALELPNACFQGSTVISYSARGIAINTGSRTFWSARAPSILARSP